MWATPFPPAYDPCFGRQLGPAEEKSDVQENRHPFAKDCGAILTCRPDHGTCDARTSTADRLRDMIVSAGVDYECRSIRIKKVRPTRTRVQRDERGEGFGIG